jgi:alpha-tubulin suppressor-like RCC1 family protein
VRALALLFVVGGCTPIPRAFRCAQSSQCVNGGVAGSCEANGWCSFPDASCTSTGRRYGQYVGDGLAGMCIVEPAVGGCVAQLALGAAHGCALRSDGTLACWGKNDHGQLGTGATSDAAAASAVVDDHGVPLASLSAVVAGDAHTCAMATNGTVSCWGDDSAGQLGRGGSAAVNAVPMLVPLSSVAAIAAGARHTCAALTTGAVWCWGANDGGQLGQAPSAGSSMPVEVVDRAGQALDAIALAAGATHSCAIARNHALVCWGSDGSGELGDGASATTNLPVQAMALGTHVTQAAAGDRFSCALGDDAHVSCFGANDRGQAGQSPGSAVPVPTALALDLVTAVAAGGAQACARRSGGALSCWGDGATVMPALDAVGAIAVGANDICAAHAGAIDCLVFGDPRLACN